MVNLSTRPTNPMDGRSRTSPQNMVNPQNYPAFTPVYGYEDSSWHPVEGRGFLYNEDGVRFPNDRAEPRQRHVLATRVMSNGVEVIVANGLEKSADKDAKSKLLRIMTTQDLDKITTLAPSTVKNNVRMTVSPEDQARNNHTSKPIHSHPRQQSLLSSSMSTSFEPYVAFHHPNTEMIPHHRHNFVIKTCYTTYTYLTTTVQKMRTTVSTYETVVSTITTEPIDFESSTATIDPQATQLQLFQATKSLDIPILQPKIDKRIDEAKPHADHDIIQPSEVTPGTTCSMASCPCTVTLTESLKNNLKTKIVNDIEEGEAPLQLKRSPFKPTKYASTIVDIAPTSLSDYKKENKPNKHKNEQSRPNSPPSEKVVQKYTEISSDAPNDANKKNDKTKINNRVTSIESEKTGNKRNSTKLDDKRKPQETPDKNKEPQKVNKNKFEVADLLKLGTLSIKRLAPMIEQMTGSLIRRQEQNKQIPSTVRPATKLTPYIVNKRVDDFPALRNDQKTSGSSQFPIYIPVDEKELETAESQNIFYNSTLQQNLAWSSQNSKNSRTNLVYSKTIHESPLLNGGIPISPGEIITANSDVIVGKPAVGGPNIGHINKQNIKINNGQNQNFHTDSHSQSSDYQDVRTKPPQRGQGIKQIPFIREDDSYDLRPPMISPPRVSYPQKDNQNIPSGIGPFNPNNQNQHSQNQHGQNQHGQNQHGQNQHGQNQHGQNQHGQIQHGQNQNVQNQHGQNQHGQNQHGQNQHGQNQHGQNQHSQHHHNQNQQNQNKQNQNQHIQNLHGQNQHSQNQHNQNQHNQFNQNQFNQNQFNQIKPQNIGQQEFNKNEKTPQFDSNRPNAQNKPPHNVFVNHIGGTIHSADSILENHGRPAFLDYIPALDTPASYQNYIKNNLITRKTHDDNANYQNTLTKNKIDPSKLSQDKHNFLTAVPNSNKKNKDAPEPILLTDLAHKNTMKPFLVDIQPSRVANVIIPHGSTTALIFAGSSEPHKNGEYIDDPLPYPEPGYFGSFSIDAPHLTSVHIGGTIPLQSNIQDSKASSSVRQETSYKNNPDPHIVNHGISGLNKDIKPPQGQRWKYEDVGPKQQPPMFHGPPNHGKMPPPISNQESNMHFGPHFVVKKPEKINNEFGAPTRNQFFNGPNNIKTTTADYEADLAVPPPPPSSIQVKYESNVGVLNSNFNKFKNGENPNKFALNPPPPFMNQERPPQNIQFGQHGNDNQQKITSEIYFASTSSHGDAGQKMKPFTLNIPAQANYNNQNSNNRPSFDNNNKFINTFDGGLVTLNAGTKVNIPNVPVVANPAFNSRPPASNINNMQYAIPQGEGLITLNAGASVFNPNLPEQTISGSLAHQQIKNSYNLQTHNVKEFHSHEGESTGIPIGTNFAIKVEPQRIEEYNPNVKINNGAVSTADFKPQEKVPEIIVGGNSWKAGTSNHGYEDDNSNNVGGIPDSVQNGNQKVHVVHASTFNNFNYDKTKIKEQDKKVSFYNATSSANSHANFPVIKEHVDNFNHFGQTVIPNIQSVKFVPSESTENKFIPLNQQGSFEKNVNFFNNYTNQRPIVVQSTSKKPNLQIQHRPISIETKPHIATVHKERPIELPSKIPTYQSNNFKVESTTHNIIPLKFDFESQRYGNINGGFGQKIPFVEMPASNSNWQSNPVLKPKDKPIPIFKDTLPEFMAPPPLTTPAYNPAYIPSNYNNKRQPVYDIPTRDTYDLTKVTLKPLFNTTKYAPTQNNYIPNNDYKTIDESDYQNVKENGELTQESMKIPILTSTLQPLNDKITISFRPLKNSTRPSDEILIGSGNDYTSYNIDQGKPQFNANDNSGSQTEKPFNENKYKEVSLVTLPGTKQTTQSTYDPPNFSQMAPRPFAVSENSKDTINNYDIYKPRPFQRPIHKDDKFVLNIGEVPAKSTTSMTSPRTTQSPTTTTTKPPNVRPQFSVKNNSLTYKNDLDKIITSSVNVATNKPFQVINITTEKPITFTTPKAKNSTIISNLSPPPPTMDYSFKPTIKDDAIVGMSPPPRTPAPKVPTKDYTKYTDVSTFRPGHNSMKNPYKRPGDFYRITTRPFTRHTGPPTPVPSRSKVTAGTTITRIVYPSRSTIPSWKNPTRVETRVPSNKQTNQHNKTPLPGVSIINTTPLSTVGPDIMHPDIYPEETIGLPPTLYKSDPVIIPDKVKPPTIYPTVVHQIKSTLSSVKPVQPTHIPTLIQASENFLDENAIKKTDILKVAPTIKETQLKPIKTQINKPTLQTSFNTIENEITIKPIHHAGNEIKQSDDDIPLKNPEPATAITFTTTLAQPASTVMTTRFVTLTHTLTVTQTKTSLVSPVVGSTTQTLVLTDTHTSTIVDVVTEIHTLVQPTTIVQTITEHVSIPSWETKYPKVPIEPTNVRDHPYKTKQISKLDDLSLTPEEEDLIIMPDNSTLDIFSPDGDTSYPEDNDTIFVVMNKSQNGGSSPTIDTAIDEENGDEITRNEEVGGEGVAQVLLGEILLAGTPFLETAHAISPTGVAYGKECQPDCKASRNERCQRMHGLMKCVCRPGFARMFPDRPCKPTYTYSMKLALSRQGNERLVYQDAYADQNSKDFQDLAMAAHEGINRMVMQSDLRDVYHGVHINGFQPVKIPLPDGMQMNGVLNDFYVQLSDNAHETRLKEVIEKYLRNNNYSLGGTNVFAAGELVDKLEVGDFNECMSNQFHDCSEHAECFNLRATYTCSCKEGYADLSVNPLYPGRICSAEPVGCEKCHYHGTCYTRDDSRVLCECFQWYAGESCQINLKVILISLATLGAILFTLLLICLIMTCAKRRRPKGHKHMDTMRRSQAPVMSSCIGNIPTIHQGHQSKMHSTMDKRALIQERGNDSGGEGSSIHNVSLPYIPAKKISQISHKSGKKMSLVDEVQSREKKPFTLMIPRAKYHPAPTTSPHMMNPNDIRDSNHGKRKSSGESSNETKLLSYLDAGPGNDNLTRRKQSNESSYSMNKGMPQKYSTGALVSAGFKVSTTVMGGPEHDSSLKDMQDDASSVAKSNTLPTLDMQSQFNSLRKAYSQEDINDWTDAERRIGELTMSEARSFDGTLVKPSTKLMRSTTGSNKSSAHYTQHEANTMAERDLGSTFLLPHVHLYKPDMGSDVSEFDSL